MEKDFLNNSPGTVRHCTNNFYIVECPEGAGDVYVPKDICAIQFHTGADVIIRAQKWPRSRQAPSLHRYKIKYKAIAISRISSAEKIINEEGQVAKRHPNRSFSIAYGKDEVYCAPRLAYPGIEEGDIVRFQAEEYANPPAYFEERGVRFQCTSMKFVKKPMTILASGQFSLIDAMGQYGYVEGKQLDGSKVTAYVHVSVVKPPCKDLNKKFDNSTPVHFRAKEQASNRRNSHTSWKAREATTQQYRINNRDEIELDPFYAEESESACSLESLSNGQSRSVIDSRATASRPAAAPSGVESQDLGNKRKQPLSSEFHQNVTCIPYDPDATDLQEQNRQLRLIAHWVTDFALCSYCNTQEPYRA